MMEDEAENDFYQALSLLLKAKGALVEGEFIKFECTFSICLHGDGVDIVDMYLAVQE